MSQDVQKELDIQLSQPGVQTLIEKAYAWLNSSGWLRSESPEDHARGHGADKDGIVAEA